MKILGVKNFDKQYRFPILFAQFKESVCMAFLFIWVARFGPPLELISDRGTQFCSELLANVSKTLGINNIRTCAYNPRANGLIERFHRCLKVALRAKGEDWHNHLAIVLLGLRMHLDAEGNSCFSRMTGEQPLMPAVSIHSGSVGEVIKSLQQLSFPYNVTRKKESKQYVPEKLKTAEFVWLRVDRVRKPLEAQYTEPYKVLQRTVNTYTIEVNGKAMTVSIERLKPAILPSRISHDHTTFGAADDDDLTDSDMVDEDDERADQTKEAQVKTTRSGRRVKIKEDVQYNYCLLYTSPSPRD